MCWAHSGPSGKLLGIHWESQESTRSPRSPLGVHWEPWPSGNYCRIVEKQEENTQPKVPRRSFGWQDGKFEPDDLERLERAWERWKGKNFATVWDEDDDEEFVRTQTLERG